MLADCDLSKRSNPPSSCSIVKDIGLCSAATRADTEALYLGVPQRAFITIGLGMTKLRREFTLNDILEFLERMRRRECPPTSAPTRPSTIMTSSGDILGFTARRAKLIAERRKHSNVPKRNG